MLRRRHERGNALTLAVLIVLAMIGLGMLAIRSTKQNLAGSGNLRTTKQARYIADLALHEAITFINRGNSQVFAQRPQGARIVLLSDGRVEYRNIETDDVMQPLPGPNAGPGGLTWTTASLLAEQGDQGARPNALGQFGQGSGLRGTFEVSVDGFRQSEPPAGNSPPQQGTAWGFCQMEFTARAHISDRDGVPDNAARNSDQAVSRFAEYTLRAGVIIRVTNASLCRT